MWACVSANNLPKLNGTLYPYACGIEIANGISPLVYFFISPNFFTSKPSPADIVI